MKSGLKALVLGSMLILSSGKLVNDSELFNIPNPINSSKAVPTDKIYAIRFSEDGELFLYTDKEEVKLKGRYEILQVDNDLIYITKDITQFMN